MVHPEILIVSNFKEDGKAIRVRMHNDPVVQGLCEPPSSCALRRARVASGQVLQVQGLWGPAAVDLL